jgi:kynurenine formamidase
MLASLAFTLSAPQAQAWDFDQGRWIDLSHDYSSETIYWPTADGFSKETVFEGQTDGGWYYTAYNIATAEHGGTHVDAPIHFSEGKQTVDEIPLQRLIGSAVVIDVSKKVARDADYQVNVGDIQSWESRHGQIPSGSIVLVNTGFAARWPDAAEYMGTGEKGEKAVAKLHFPGIHPYAAKYLAGQRNVSSVGIDTPSIDFGQSKEFMTHRILFEQNIPGFENLTSLDELPPTGALVIALPMKIKGGSGGPLRIVAFVPDVD